MYAVLIDVLVFAEDFKEIHKADQQKILKAIRKKLAVEPEKYGKPLSGSLKGLWKLRVGPFRVIYAIKKVELSVYVAKVGFRRDAEVYREILKRLK